MVEVWLSQNNYMNSTCTKFTIRTAFTLFHISLETFKNYSYFNKSRNNPYSINQYIILQHLHLLSIFFFTYSKKNIYLCSYSYWKKKSQSWSHHFKAICPLMNIWIYRYLDVSKLPWHALFSSMYVDHWMTAVLQRPFRNYTLN